MTETGDEFTLEQAAGAAQGGAEHAILIVEPSEVIRVGLSSMAESIPSVAGAIACADLDAALTAVATCELSSMLVSASLGAASTQRLREEATRNNIKCLITMHERDQWPDGDALEMVSHGIVILDNLTTDSFTDTLQCLAQDQAVMPITFLRKVLRESASRGKPSLYPVPALSSRESEILVFVAEGLSNKQIARRIAISENGVKRHVANILAKTNSANRTQAVSYAIQAGLLQSPPATPGLVR